MKKSFLDAEYVIALEAADDRNHQAALSFDKHFAQAGFKEVTVK